ncbi:MAG: hypothetical protein ACOYVF_11135 [Candidatus Zixiibacteriota bacterium]
MDNYSHTQFAGWPVVFPLGVCILITVYFGVIKSETFGLLTSVVFIVLMVLFYSLKITVDEKYLRLRYGIGLIRIKFPVREIMTCETVRNRWWYGLGIRVIPEGWLFNINGLDAVRVNMRNRTVYRFGTDEPDKLCQAINRFIHA